MASLVAKAARPASTLVVATAVLLSLGAARAQPSGLAPGDAGGALDGMRYRCVLEVLCPVSALNYHLLEGAAAGRRGEQFLIGLNLLKGDGVPRDRAAGTAWIASAAEAGLPAAASWVERALQEGADIEVDESKVAAALKRQADAGDTASTLVLAPMLIRGRGVEPSPAAGIALLRAAGERGTDGNAAFRIAELYLVGANGLPRDHEEAIRWYTLAASRGHVLAMATLGGLWQNRPMAEPTDGLPAGQSAATRRFEPDIVQSYCWRMRAALMDSTLAQYELARMLTERRSDDRGNVIDADLVQADVWFRLGARDPTYNDPRLRAAIEPNLTTAQLEEARDRVAAWRAFNFERLKATAIAVPTRPARACPAMP